MHVIEHYIQRDILERLMRAEHLRFSELKPDGMESNIFMYHLKLLIKQEYVHKVTNAYGLAAKGLSYVDGLSTVNHKPRQQPKLIVLLVLCTPTGKWLLVERKIQPYIGSRMFISGKQHRGETSAEHAVRELREKTGLVDIPLIYRGVADIQISDSNDILLTHAVAMVYEGELVTEELPSDTDRFHFVWHDFTHDQQALMPGTNEILEQLRIAGIHTITIEAKQGLA